MSLAPDGAKGLTFDRSSALFFWVIDNDQTPVNVGIRLEMLAKLVLSTPSAWEVTQVGASWEFFNIDGTAPNYKAEGFRADVLAAAWAEANH
jgi:hypothetical protein